VLCGFQGAFALCLASFVALQQRLAYSIKLDARCQAQFRDFPHKTPDFQLSVKAAFASFDRSQYFIAFLGDIQAVILTIHVNAASIAVLRSFDRLIYFIVLHRDMKPVI
jgi:hypothetical protein